MLDGIVKGSELLTWTITGDDNGTPFTLVAHRPVRVRYDIAFESPWDVADLVYVAELASRASRSTTSRSTVTSSTTAPTWRLATVEQKRGGQWVKVSRHKAG